MSLQFRSVVPPFVESRSRLIGRNILYLMGASSGIFVALVPLLLTAETCKLIPKMDRFEPSFSILFPALWLAIFLPVVVVYLTGYVERQRSLKQKRPFERTHGFDYAEILVLGILMLSSFLTAQILLFLLLIQDLPYPRPIAAVLATSIVGSLISGYLNVKNARNWPDAETLKKEIKIPAWAFAPIVVVVLTSVFVILGLSLEA